MIKSEDSEYAIGDVVWAKMKGYPAWPARVAQRRKKMKNAPRKSMHCIFFYGTHNFAWIDEKDIKPYKSYKTELEKQSKLATFKNGIAEIDDFIRKKAEDPAYEEKEFDEDDDEEEVEEEEDIGETSDEDFDKLKNSSVDEKIEKKPVPVKKRASTIKTPTAKRARKSYGDNKEPSSYISPSRAFNKVRSYHAILDRPSVMEVLETPNVDMNEISENIKNKKITASTKRFGFLGLGIMGSEIVKNLIHSGHKISIWNRSAEKAENIREQAELMTPGMVETCKTPADVVQNSEIIFCCVSDPSAVKQIMIGNCGILSVKNSMLGKGYVEMSNIDDKTSTDLAEMITENGGRYLEAQLQGSKEEAHNGSLIILGAGERSLFDDCDSCWKAIGKTVFFLGETGYATKLNLVLQVVRGINLAGLAEGFALASLCGLNLDDTLRVFKKTNLCNPFLQGKAQMMISNDYTMVQQSLQNMQKDMSLALQMADVVKLPMSLSATTNTVYMNSVRGGFNLHDSAAVFMATRH